MAKDLREEGELVGHIAQSAYIARAAASHRAECTQVIVDIICRGVRGVGGVAILRSAGRGDDFLPYTFVAYQRQRNLQVMFFVCVRGQTCLTIALSPYCEVMLLTAVRTAWNT